MSLFIESDSDNDDDDIRNELKRQFTLDWDNDYHDKRIKIENDVDLDESDLEWEDIDLDISPKVATGDQPLSIPSGDESLQITLEDKQRKIQSIIDNKRRKLTIHNLGLVSYMMHCQLRNKLINSKPVLKTLKKLLPEEIIHRVKTLKKSIKKHAKDCDVQLIYIIKYLIKWFRLNFKITCNGLRILGYLPKGKDPQHYFQQNCPPFNNLKQFISLVKRFQHNRDFGSQIFTGILRCLGFEARMVFSIPVLPGKSTKLQPKLDKPKLERNKDFDLLYPYFWTELINPINDEEILVIDTCTFHDEDKRITRLNRFACSLTSYSSIFYPVQDQFNDMIMNYVISIDNNDFIMDASARYMKNICYRSFKTIDLRSESGKSLLLYLSIIRILNKSHIEYETDDKYHKELKSLQWLSLNNFDIPQTKTAIKRNPNFTTHDSLRYDETIDPRAKPINKLKIDNKLTSIYFKSSIIVGKSQQQWKFLGRSIKPDEHQNFIKTTKALVPRTIHRKRMYELNIRNNQPELNEVKLYAFHQTCPYIKQKIENGKLPKNKYGNIEIFRNSMIPDNVTWLTLANIETILNHKSNHDIEFVPVVTGFKFNKLGYAIPNKTGVIIKSDQLELAKQFWIKFKLDQRKQQMKLRKEFALITWLQILKRLHIKHRLNNDYGNQ